jgi:adenylate cyclase
MERRLSAILAADVVGYSRLMGANEVGTLTSLKAHRAELIDPAIAAQNGRIVKLTGDGLLAEFTSVVNAVECATQVQRGMRERNADVAEDRRIEFRIGINLGDVIVDDDDLFGDGVNVAARLESVSRPGGIAVSQSVRQSVGNRLDLEFEDVGEQQLKNIEFPVRVYNVQFADQPSSAPGNAPAQADEADKPSIAVLPFNNMSGDVEQEYFSDGIAEDIITDLSKISRLFVVGRNTSFTYKGKVLQLQQVASELGVKFLLEGSVRKSGNRVRVTGQLIDGITGGHLWADRYDRDLTDIFAIQDEITHAIVEQLKIRLLPTERRAIAQAPTVNVEAYSCYLKGRHYFHNTTRAFLVLAREMFAKAVELDPAYARAYAGIADCDTRLAGWYGVVIPVDQILAAADKAIQLDPGLADAHAARGHALSILGRGDEAISSFEHALGLDPNSFEANFFYARECIKACRNDRAVELLTRALELQPEDTQAPFLLQQVLRSMGRNEEAERYTRLGVRRAEEAIRLHPESSRPAQGGACALAAIGEKEQARKWIERALAIDPDDTHLKYNAACVFAQIGETERAIELLERWAANPGLEVRVWLERDPDLDSLRDHPRFTAILDQIDAGLAERVAST